MSKKYQGIIIEHKDTSIKGNHLNPIYITSDKKGLFDTYVEMGTTDNWVVAGSEWLQEPVDKKTIKKIGEELKKTLDEQLMG